MASRLLVLPSARIFVGPGDRLFGYDRIWVVVYAGRGQGDGPDRRAPRDHHFLQGRHGEESKDLELLSDVLRLSNKGTASARQPIPVSLSSHTQRTYTMSSLKHCHLGVFHSRVRGITNRLTSQNPLMSHFLVTRH
jgi:hypothetical protein